MPLSDITSRLAEFARRHLRHAGWQLTRPVGKLACGAKVALSSQSDWDVFVEVFGEGEYDLPIMETLSSPASRPITILDLGANIGMFTARVAQIVHRCPPPQQVAIVAVEGNASTHKRLLRTIDDVRSDVLQVRPIHGLVGKRHGVGFITSNIYAGAQCVLPPHRRSWNPLRNAYAIPACYVDLATLMSPDVTIDLIKCDIEGSERDFIEHYEQLLCRTSRIVIELHPLHVDVNACRRRLAELGFYRRREIRSGHTVALEYYVRNPDV